MFSEQELRRILYEFYLHGMNNADQEFIKMKIEDAIAQKRKRRKAIAVVSPGRLYIDSSSRYD